MRTLARKGKVENWRGRCTGFESCSRACGPYKHQELLAAREEDRKARKAGVDVELVDATLVQPHELVAVAAELF